LTVGRIGVSHFPETGSVELNDHYKEWRIQQGVWVQEGNAPDAVGGMAALITETTTTGKHYLGDTYSIPGGRGIVALTCDIKPKTGRPWFVVTANGNPSLATVYRLRPNQPPEIQSQPTAQFCKSNVLPVGFGYFRCRTQVIDFDGIGFFLIATLNLLGDADYTGNLNLGYHLSRVRLRYRCL
jgi:hypothetical protein